MPDIDTLLSLLSKLVSVEETSGGDMAARETLVEAGRADWVRAACVSALEE
jgi:hypothetical protein